MYRSLAARFSNGRVARPSVVHLELFVGPPGIIAGRVSITAAAIIGLVLLLFICGAQGQREKEGGEEGQERKKSVRKSG